MFDEQWCVKFLSKRESWLDKVIFLGYIAFKEGIFMDLKTLRLMSHEEDSQMLWRLKKNVCLVRLLMMNCGRTIYDSEYYIYE